MSDTDQSITIPVEADLTAFSTALDDLSKHSRSFAAVFTNSIRSAVTSGRSFEDTLKQMALSLSGVALQAGLKPLQNLTSNLIGSVLGGAGQTPNVTPFAKGGVVSSPSYFTAGGSLGVAGEAGPEAILPLARGSDGRLGVRAGGQGGGAMNVTFNIATPDVTGFAKSQTQVSAMLARTVGRGRRAL
ncbi:MAG: phage tail tape measure protein [Pseudomonadota bacterium]